MMAILTLPKTKTIFDHSLKLARLPLDAVLAMFGNSDLKQARKGGGAGA